ncbi:hypothetical protein E3P89_00746 [Wallemia ichthyophaga]|uniref:DNA mismatch repair proteins mutS family domain-containing protein n=1 Tax=Wallemia ichthyophaga TaxID=245174 RepID=A0A4T0HJB7_WALIC|nr:hypothetical protein E3P90_00959 [Wallemia ichthyophaga]TIB16883.1 hypothetical protein E3P93_00816 [Wallemia ichthyophaga]TIB24991.1 hypothetical protein E3P89_00746 [Wallemia ichthyophaga]TIB26607.1 hypothetical protein E3P88_00828 [Wallemia ichthyophaga]
MRLNKIIFNSFKSRVKINLPKPGLGGGGGGGVVTRLSDPFSPINTGNAGKPGNPGNPGTPGTPLITPTLTPSPPTPPDPSGFHPSHLSSDLLKNVINTINAHPDTLLLTRVGGFYEAYYHHALLLSKLLGFSVGEKSYNKSKFPMAGFPYYQLSKHLRSLVVDHCLFVAINDQFYNHKSGSFDRKVTRVISPGTLLDESSLNPTTHNFIVSVVSHPEQDQFAAAWCDISTGDSSTASSSLSDLKSYIARLSPSEIVFDGGTTTAEAHKLRQSLGAHDSIISYSQPNANPSASTHTQYTPHEHTAISLLQTRLQASLIDDTPSLQPKREEKATLMLDAPTIRGLELKTTIRSNRTSGSLMRAVRRTITQPGHRLLEQWLCEPSADLSVIRSRHAAVAIFLSRTQLRRDVRALLRDTQDGPRLLQRVLLNNNFTPSLLLAVKGVIEKTEEVVRRIRAEWVHERGQQSGCASENNYDNDDWHALLTLTESLHPLITFAERIDSVIIEDGLRAKEASESESEQREEIQGLPEEREREREAIEKDGRERNGDNYHDDLKRSIAPTYSATIARLNKKLDRLYGERAKLAREVRGEVRASDPTHVALRSNQKLGHYITARKSSLKALPGAYQLIASGKSTATYAHPRWTALKSSIVEVSEQLEGAEREALTGLKGELAKESERFRANTHLLAQLDVLCSLAELADERAWVRPAMTVDRALHISQGRHPAVEVALQDSLNSFTPNDVLMQDDSFVCAIFGPNMGGKSTYLRQNAIIVVLAQAGSFVPATAATIGVVDRLFSRIGASDDLSAGQSTFMVEMTEAGEILQMATPRSLVIMDEIGRGTTSLDGLALAYAIVVHLALTNKCRTFFATHFHELDDMLADTLPIQYLSTDLVDGGDAFRFTYTLRKGVCKESHGIIVARLAGLPIECIDRAQIAHDTVAGAHSHAHAHTHDYSLTHTHSLNTLNRLKHA